jgi:broad specificity phosphatase PhoE
MSLLYLVRHGETNHNAEGRGLGRADLPLSDVGREQMRLIALRLNPVPLDRVLSSPLERAAAIARLIAGCHALALEVRPELTELDVGETEGMTFAEIRERFPGFYARWTGDDPVRVVMPGGESLADVAARLQPLAGELLSGPDRVTVILSHNFTLRVLICVLLAVPVACFRNFRLDLASITTLSIQRGRAAIQALNDVCHLEALNLAPPARSFST